VSDSLLALLPDWGPVLLALVTFLSCLALPIPASLLMLAGGAFAAGGDLALSGVTGAALAGAVVGDITGYVAGRGSSRLLNRVSGKRKLLLARARKFTARRGVASVFLSRWLFSPLGPYVNLVAGAVRMPWLPFLLAGIAGEAVWVGLYVGAGYLFADRIEALAALAGNLSGALAAGAVTVGLGLALWRAARRRQGGVDRRLPAASDPCTNLPKG
jgi:membrane-associated protein